MSRLFKNIRPRRTSKPEKQSALGGLAWGRKNNAGKIRRAKIKNIRKIQVKKGQPKKKHNRKKRKRIVKINWKKLGVIFLIICFGIFTIWVLFFSSAMQITDVEIIGYNEKSSELIELVRSTERRKILNQSISNNLILFSGSTLEKTIRAKYPIVNELDIQKVFPNKLVIKIVKRQELFLWNDDKSCQFLDKQGKSIEIFDCDNNERNLLNICAKKIAELGVKCQVFINYRENKNLMDSKDIEKILNAGQIIINNLKTTFYFEEGLIVSVPNITSEDIIIKSESNGEILFSMSHNLDKQLNKFRALLEKKISLNDLRNMAYIDLRLNNKIIYRFKEGYNNKELKIKNEE